MALTTASRTATLFHNGVSIRSIGVIVAATLFSISNLDNTLLVAIGILQFTESLQFMRQQKNSAKRMKPNVGACFGIRIFTGYPQIVKTPANESFI